MFKKIKIFVKNNPIHILWLLTFIYTLPVYNKYWAPFDEGIILVAAQRLLRGEIPYKDFFILMYPPGQIYVLLAIFKFFSSPLIMGRVYTVFISAATSMLAFSMTHILTKNMVISILSWLIALTSLAPRLGAIPAPIWPGILFSLSSIYLFMRYLKSSKVLYIIAAGLVNGLAITFRHDIGIFALIAVLSSLSIQALHKKTFKNILFFVVCTSLVVLPWVAYFINISASKDILDSLVRFAFVHQGTARIPFPQPCLDLNMIFHGSLQFININQFYIPLLVYAYIFILFLNKKFIHSSYNEAEALALLSITLFGIFTFNQVRIRPDPAHLLTVIEPAIILTGFILHNAFRTRRLTGYVVSITISILFTLLLIKNIDKYIKNTYTKVYKKSIVKTRFDKGSIYLPKEEYEDVSNTVKFIKEHTKFDDRIYIGNTAHWKDDFGGSVIIYYLADRLPSTKFYELAPGLITSKKVQEEIMDSLRVKDVKLIVLQDVDTTGLKPDEMDKDRFILDDFIQHNYKPAAKFGKYNIYNKVMRK